LREGEEALKIGGIKILKLWERIIGFCSTGMYRALPCLVVVSGLQEIDGFLADAIYQPVFLRDTARPTPGEHILERFGFARAFERVSHDCVNQIEDPDCSGTLVFHPEPEVLKELRLEYGDPLRPSLHRASLYAVRRLFPV
jgi:hypothetical protein